MWRVFIKLERVLGDLRDEVSDTLMKNHGWMEQHFDEEPFNIK
jgi:hypothetical protein